MTNLNDAATISGPKLVINYDFCVKEIDLYCYTIFRLTQERWSKLYLRILKECCFNIWLISNTFIENLTTLVWDT